MTAKQVFEYALIELNKVQAPSLLLEDYNYFINKAINQFVNKTYNMYDVNQQKSDDVRVLKSTAVLIPKDVTEEGEDNPFDSPYTIAGTTSDLFGTTKEVDLPDDYLHILNCVVEYNVTKNYKCYDAGKKVHFGATRLTSDMFSQIINNYYMRPSYKLPYFYVNNVTTDNDYVTKDSQEDIPYGFTPSEMLYEADGVTYKKDDDGNVMLKDGTPITRTNIEKIAEHRFGNKGKVRMEIRYGKDDTLFKLNKVYIDYLKAPQFIRLTQEQVDMVQDKSQILEFQDYVCQEIVNELVTLLLENASDPRLQSQIPINQSIANPAQGQEQPQRRR